jgi:hypothetical protein
MRRAAAAIRRLGVPLEWTYHANDFRNAGLRMDADELDKVAKTLDRFSQSCRRGPEPKVPDIPAHAPPALRLRLPVSALARPRCADGGTATLTLGLLQLLEADLLPTTFATLPAPRVFLPPSCLCRKRGKAG